MTTELYSASMLAVAVTEARKGLAEGGIPIGAAIFNANGKLFGSGHNRREDGDPPFATPAASGATVISSW
jgi:tRNA(Arg) A34 adenosine deaminase TadA